jgi:hypothetical protein
MALAAGEVYGNDGFNRNPLNALFLLYEERLKPLFNSPKQTEDSMEEFKEPRPFEWTKASTRKLFLSAVKTDDALELVVEIKQTLTPLFQKHSSEEALSQMEFESALAELPFA